MAALIKGLKFVSQITNNSPAFMYTATRFAGHWNKDFKPALYPTTKEELDSAAKKYNLLPEEYRPYADDGLGYGDYPKIEAGLGIEARDPYYPYDFPEHKRNFNEPLHADIDLYGEDRFSQPAKPRFSNAIYFSSFFGVMGFCFALYYLLENMRMFRPVLPKQYAHDGKKHYIFEVDDKKKK